MKPPVILYLGGGRSGKSWLAHQEALTYGGERGFLATAPRGLDEEMDDRIRRHRLERGTSFRTWEEELEPAALIRTLSPMPSVVLLDCLSVWLGNLFHHGRTRGELCPEIDDLLCLIEEPPCPLILVSNEVGLGLIPEHPLGRAYRDLAGRVNREVAARANRVLFVVAGLTMVVKEAW